MNGSVLAKIFALLLLLGPAWGPPLLAANPWEIPQGQACFEQWIADSMARLNRHQGPAEFNARKPWSINRYGVLEGNTRIGPTSPYAPDDFPSLGYNKYWWMWEHYLPSSSFDPGWRDANWNAAGVPRLREFVNDCVRRASGNDISGPIVPPPPPPGTACGHMLGSGIYDKWISTGGEQGFLGCPSTNELEAGSSPQGTSGRYAIFRGGDGGYIIWHGAGKHRGTAFEVHGCIFLIYRTLGTSSWLGFPVSDEYSVPGGRRSDFEGGYVLWEESTRQCAAHRSGSEGESREQFCDRYGRTAVSQNDENVRRGCGYGGARWQSNYENHRGWCLNTDAWTADWETSERQNELGRCRGGGEPPPPPPPPPGTSEYIGCFADENDRDLPFDAGMNNTNTRESCIGKCRDRGFRYAGVQSNYCYCGNSYGRYERASVCDIPCPGNPQQLCGGRWANDVFSTGVTAPRR